MAGTLVKGTFTAVLDKIQMHEFTITVEGEVAYPTGGWKAHLEEASPQGIIKETLILNVKNSAPTGIVDQMVTSVKVFYQDMGKPYVEHVTIQNGDQHETIDVQVIS